MSWHFMNPLSDNTQGLGWAINLAIFDLALRTALIPNPSPTGEGSQVESPFPVGEGFRVRANAFTKVARLIIRKLSTDWFFPLFLIALADSEIGRINRGSVGNSCKSTASA